MSASVNSDVLDLLASLANLDGVRGVTISTSEGAYADGLHSGLQPAVAHDVAKTVRRMVVASMTANAPLEELLINFGPSRLMLRPMSEDAILIALLDRDTKTAPLRSHLDTELIRLRRLLEGGSAHTMPTINIVEGDDEIAELLASELGPVLREIEKTYRRYRQRAGVPVASARESMHNQMREWLLCCNPSPYTFPLLLDGLSETMVDDPDGRNRFVSEVHEILRRSGAVR